MSGDGKQPPGDLGDSQGDPQDDHQDDHQEDPEETIKYARVSRRQWKSAITRHLGNMRRDIAEEDVDSLRHRLEVIKDSYSQFEDAHADYHQLLENEDDIDQSDSWYEAVEQNYIDGVTRARTWLKAQAAAGMSKKVEPAAVSIEGHVNPTGLSYPVHTPSHSIGASAHPSGILSHTITQSVPSLTASKPDVHIPSLNDEIVNLLTIPKVVIDKFDGNPLDFQSFFATFDELVDNRTDDASTKLTRLLQYTAGPAKQCIKFCALVGGADGYAQARAILKDRFGNKHLVAQKIINGMKSGNPVSKSTDIRQLADELKTGYTALESLGMVTEVDTQQNIKHILNRFPKYVKNKWHTHSLKHKKQHDMYPPFSDFVTFINDKASDCCDPVYGDVQSENLSGQKASNFFSASHNMKSSQSHAFGANHANPVGTGTVLKPCVVCNQTHDLFRCESFKGLPPRQRLDVVKRHKLCFNCLRGTHFVGQCTKQTVCSVPGCGQKHTKFIHVDIQNRSGANEVSNNSTDQGSDATPRGGTNASLGSVGSSIHLPIVSVTVNGTCEVLALLDSGSTNTFISEELASQLNLTGQHVDYRMTTLSQQQDLNVKVVTVDLDSSLAPRPVTVNNILVVHDIPARAPAVKINQADYPHLAGIPLVKSSAKVQMLLGMDNAHLLMPLDVRHNDVSKSDPYAVRSYFGWTVNGSAGNNQLSEQVHSNFAVTIEQQIENLWSMDNNDDVCGMSSTDRNVINLWDETTVHENGHYTICIPWREGKPDFPENRFVAVRRLNSLVTRLNRTGMYDKYSESLTKMITDGYVERVPDNELNLHDGSVWYLPHHPVISPAKPDKVRIVHDCAASYSGVCLNSEVHQGPDLNCKLIDVLLRFRQFPYAVMADVEAMYMQVKIPPKDRSALRFLWYERDKLVEYQMQRHLFGGKFCSSSSTYALRRTVEDCPVKPSELVRSTIFESMYVDDLLKSIKTTAEAREVVGGTKSTLKHGSFNLTKFVANDMRILSEIPEDDRAKEVKEIMPEMMSKALGIRWEVCGDTLRFISRHISFSDTVTRRVMLSHVSSMYDPLGLISPVTLLGKVMFQNAVRLKLDWDTGVPEALASAWTQWLDSLDGLQNVRIDRCLIPQDFLDGVAEIHTFCDGSLVGYGACSYIRLINQHGSVHVALIAAKSKLAPVKQVTVPRLELAAAVTAVRLDSLIRRDLEIPLLPSTFWSDSEIVLSYIRNETRRFKIYVANRVSHIRQASMPNQWRHIEGKLNPADVASRGCIVRELPTTWFTGPAFLKCYKCDWPRQDVSDAIIEGDPEVYNESVNAGCFFASDEADHPLKSLTSHYSSFYRLRKAVAWLIRCRDTLLKRDVSSGLLTVSELNSAEKVLIRQVQHETYGVDIASLTTQGHVPKSSPIVSLNPTLHDDVLVVGGRLKHAPLALQTKFPVILPYGHRLSRLIVHEYHGTTHLGVEWTLANVRAKYWIVSARKLIKKVKTECVVCKKHFAKPMTQMMSDLPPERCQPNYCAFAFSGVDVFGPFKVKYGRAEIKRYAIIYSCFNTRAVYVDLLDSLETDTFINAFVRFVARRGNVIKMFSDNGTNFAGAQTELAKAFKAIDRKRVIIAARRRNVEWVFNVPTASHHGGVWERQIRSVRKVLTAILTTSTRLTDDILRTFLIEAESIVNSRPLTKCSDDVTDDAPLTPNHFLILSSTFSYPWGQFYDGETYRRRWKFVQSLVDTFWKKWVREYIPELQRRSKWLHTQPNLAVGDLVLIVDENSPRGAWPLGLVQEVKMGRDGLVRSAKLKTKSSVLVRPITKLVHLECS